MAREFAEETEVLTAIRDRLIDQIDGVTDKNCFLSDHPYPATIPHGDIVVTVSPGGGTFDQGMFAGAGFEQVTEETRILVSVFRRSMADRPDERDGSLTNESRGLLKVYKKAILKALLIDDSSGTRLVWEPTKNGDGLLRDQLSPVSSNPVEHVETVDGVNFRGVSITFSAVFDWSL